MEKKDFFYQASGLFLTEHLTQEQYDEKHRLGEIPVCADYENWDVDYIEEAIVQFADELEKAYQKGKTSNN